MLNISFFITAFSSMFWVIFCFKHLHLENLNQLSEIDYFYKSVIITLLPIIAIWSIFAILKFYINQRRILLFINHIASEIQKNNQTNSQSLTSVIKIEKELKSSFISSEFDTIISNINEILIEVIKRSNAISSAQIETLWERTVKGERWIIAKTFIETNNFQTNFSKQILTKAKKDNLLRGSILEFYDRFQDIHKLLNQYDQQRLFYNMFEYSALGKVFNLLSPIAEALSTDSSYIEPPLPKLEEPEDIKIDTPIIEPIIEFPSFLSNTKTTKITTSKKSKQDKNSAILKDLEKDINTSLTNSTKDLTYPFGDIKHEANS